MNALDPVPCTTERSQVRTTPPGRSAMSLYAEDRYVRACRMVVYALTADDPVIWGDTATILARRLTTKEIAMLASTALRALEHEARETVCDAATYDHGPCEPEPSGWNLEAIAEYRAARDRGAVRS